MGIKLLDDRRTGLLDSPTEGPRCHALLWGGKRRAVRWATQRAALGDAACCDGTCSALRHMAGNAVVWRVLPKVAVHTSLPSGTGRFSAGRPTLPAFRLQAFGRLVWVAPASFTMPCADCGGWGGGVLPLLLGGPKKKAWHTPRGAAMLLLGWAIRFRTRTKTTKMSCATITP